MIRILCIDYLKLNNFDLIQIKTLFNKIFRENIIFVYYYFEIIVLAAVIFGKNSSVTLKTKFYCQIRVFTLIPRFFITQQI